MGFKCGIVGLPNAGKSTIFNALTGGHAVCAPYPFTTIDANIGIVSVPDERLEALAKIVPNDKVIPTTIEFIDIAGLVEGASHGEGLGNQFLAKIMEVDAIAHVVRCFEKEDVVHPTGAIEPQRDIEIVEHELILKDLEIIDKFIAKTEKLVKSGDRKAEVLLNNCRQVRNKLNCAVSARLLEISVLEQLKTAGVELLTAKPLFYVANISERDLGKSSGLAGVVQDYASRHMTEAISICGKVEEELVQLDQTDRQDFMKEIGLAQLSLKEIISCGYKLLGLITFFTTDSRQLRAWTVLNGTKAPHAAGKIHSDFEKGFIRAEVISYNVFIECESEHIARQKGLMKIEGKEYTVQDADIIHFRFLPPTQHK